MAQRKNTAGDEPPAGIDLKEEDIIAAMGQMSGYVDITPGDFKEIYVMAYQHAVARLSREVTADEVMTRDVVTVRPEMPLAGVAQAMGQRGVSGVPVVDEGGKVLGVVSEKDFLGAMGVKESQNFMTLVAACLRTKGCVALPIKKQTAADLMSSPAITVPPDARVRDIADLFAVRRINRAPVTDADGRLLGIITRGDLLKATQRGGRP